MVLVGRFFVELEGRRGFKGIGFFEGFIRCLEYLVSRGGCTSFVWRVASGFFVRLGWTV